MFLSDFTEIWSFSTSDITEMRPVEVVLLHADMTNPIGAFRDYSK
jgi:hypothetical protein